MPASRRSLAVTEAYRDAVERLHQTLAAQARSTWPLLTSVNGERGVDLDAGYERWLSALVPALAAAQSVAVSTSGGYLDAFLASELDEPTRAERGTGRYVGVSRDSRPLRDALRGPLITVKANIGRGLPVALRLAQVRALRALGMEVDHAARMALQDGLIVDPRIEGYDRAVRGTCGACLGAATGTFGTGVPFLVHPGCKCVSEPRVAGVPNRFPRPTGEQLFAAMSVPEQDEALGPGMAEAVRSGHVTLASLVALQHQERTQDFITQAPLGS